MAQYFRGVNIAGAEFGASHLPGILNTHYTYNSEATYRYFSARNLNLVRLPLQWERLQPVLRRPLDPLNLELLKTVTGWAKDNGIRLILDIQNFGRYSMTENGTLTTYVIDAVYHGVVKVSRADLADLWVRLSKEFASEPAVYAYDLMNEPHDMAGWKEISQFVLSAIRENGDGKLIMVPGDSWSSANRWVSVHGPAAWIRDPADHFLYEAHQYFDFDESGAYARSYDTELQSNPALATVGTTRVRHFLDWCASNGVRGYLGEYGVPDNDPRWLAVLEDFLKTLDAAGMSGTYWAAGEWWPVDNALAIQPLDNFTVDRPQMPCLLRHLAPGAFTSVSAASNAGATFAPGALMSGYGTGWVSGQTEVELTDSSGAVLRAPLLYISAGQINYRIPGEAVLGRVHVAAISGGTVVCRGSYVLERVAPTLFSATGDARGPAAAYVVRVAPDGSQTFEYTVAFDTGQQKYVARPVAFGEASERLFLVLFGTGFGNAALPESATLAAGNVSLAITYLGPQPQTAGLDQLNAEVPRSLAGAGAVPIMFQVDGKQANPVTIAFR